MPEDQRVRWLLLIVVVVLIALLLSGAVTIAHAQDGSTMVDLSPVISAFVAFLGAALTAIGGWAITILQRWLGMQLDERARQALYVALENGITYAMERLRSALPAEIDARDRFIAQAANYVSRSVPDALARFDITPMRLKELIEARLTEVPVIGPVDAPRAEPLEVALVPASDETPAPGTPQPPQAPGHGVTEGIY